MRAPIAAIAVSALLSGAYLGSALAQPTGIPSIMQPQDETPGPAVGVRFLPPPAGDFDPLSASAEELERTAYPPRPDIEKLPKAYERWKKAVALRKPQIIGSFAPANDSATLTPTSIVHGPARNLSAGVAKSPSNSIVFSNSSNWSGPAIFNIVNPLNVEAIQSEFVVPKARQAFGKCSGGWDYSSLWPGIDGFGSSDVLQAGVEADAYCNGATQAEFYSAWIEWYPFNSTRVSLPQVGAGDLVFIQVWNTSPTQGWAYIANFSNLQAATYSLVAPSGTTLSGSSVEWIVERPGVGGGLANLTNYIVAPWSIAVAWDYTATPFTVYHPGQDPGGSAALY